jgi:acyl carrier protein
VTLATIEQAILTSIRTIADRKPGVPGLLQREHRLISDLGMDSMDIAELVAVLEEQLGDDPFAEAASIADVRTIGDLIEIYGRRAT